MANRQYSLWRRVVALFNPWADRGDENPFLEGLEESGDGARADPRGDRRLEKVVLLGLQPPSMTRFADAIAGIVPQASIVVRSLDEAEESLAELDGALLIVGEVVDGLSGPEVVRRFRASGVASLAFVLSSGSTTDEEMEALPEAASYLPEEVEPAVLRERIAAEFELDAESELELGPAAWDDDGTRDPTEAIQEHGAEVLIDDLDPPATDEMTEETPQARGPAAEVRLEAGAVATDSSLEDSVEPDSEREVEEEMTKEPSSHSESRTEADRGDDLDEVGGEAGLPPIPAPDEGSVPVTMAAVSAAGSEASGHSPEIVDTASRAFAEDLMNELRDADLVVTGERKLPSFERSSQASDDPDDLDEAASEVLFEMDDVQAEVERASESTADEELPEDSVAETPVQAAEPAAVPEEAADDPGVAAAEVEQEAALDSRSHVEGTSSNGEGVPAAAVAGDSILQWIESQREVRDALQGCVDVLRRSEESLGRAREEWVAADASEREERLEERREIEQRVAEIQQSLDAERTRSAESRDELKALRQELEEQELRFDKERRAFSSFESDAAEKATAQEGAAVEVRQQIAALQKEREALRAELEAVRTAAQNAASEAAAVAAAVAEVSRVPVVRTTDGGGSGEATVVAEGPWKGTKESPQAAESVPDAVQEAASVGESRGDGSAEDSRVPLDQGAEARDSEKADTRGTAADSAEDADEDGTLEGDRALLKLRNELADMG